MRQLPRAFAATSVDRSSADLLLRGLPRRGCCDGHGQCGSGIADDPSVWLRRIAVLATMLSAACSGEQTSTLRPAEMTPRAVAMEFAKAVVSDDFETARALVCERAPDPAGAGRFPFRDARVIGLPDTEAPPRAHVIVLDPAPDLYVLFEATEGVEDVSGFIWVTFGADQCVASYGEGRAGVE